MQQQLWSSYMNVAQWSRHWNTDVRDKKQYLPVQQEDCIDPRKVLLCSALIVGLYMIATTSPVTSPELIGAGCSVSNLDQFNALAALQLQAASANSLTAPTTAVPRLKPVVTTRRFLGNSVRMHPYPYYYVQYVPISSKPELVGPTFTLFIFLFSSYINGLWHLKFRRKILLLLQFKLFVKFGNQGDQLFFFFYNSNLNGWKMLKCFSVCKLLVCVWACTM